MKTLVSILMPSYNYEDYIEAAIESVLKQTYTNWELIIIDDGSTDNSVKLINSYKDKRIRFFQQTNKGVTKTLNKALKISKGDYICFLDADDYYHPDKLKEQLNLTQKGYEIITTQIKTVNEDGEESSDKFFDLWWNTFDEKEIFDSKKVWKFFNGNYLCKSALMIKRSLFQKHGSFNENLITSYDLELWLKMIPDSNVTRCNKILTFYRWHNDNETIVNVKRLYLENLLLYNNFLSSTSKDLEKNIISLVYFLERHGFYRIYVALQLYKTSLKTKDSYSLLYDADFMSLYHKLLENHLLDYKFITEGEGDLSSIKNPSIIQRLRRKLFPYKIRKFLKSLLSKNF